MQNTIVKAFEGDDRISCLVLDQGGDNGETHAWLETWWDNYYLRGSVLFDATGAVGSQYYDQPSTGLPFGRGFIIGRDGTVLHPYFGHRPAWAIETLEQLLETYLIADSPSLSAGAGGAVDFSLVAGKAQADRGYILLAGASGTAPGFLIPGGSVTLPLNFDLVTSAMLPQLNTPTFTNFMGVLDGHGNGQATLQSGPLGPGAVGVVLNFAYLLWNPFDFVSNPVAVEIVP